MPIEYQSKTTYFVISHSQFANVILYILLHAAVHLSYCPADEYFKWLYHPITKRSITAFLLAGNIGVEKKKKLIWI